MASDRSLDYQDLNKDDAESLRRQITGTVSYLRLSLADETGLGSEQAWHSSAALLADGSHLLDLVAEASAARGIDRADIGLSLFVQAYAFRVASAALAGWILTGGKQHLDVSPDNLSIQLGRNRPNAVRFDAVRFAESSIHSSLFGHHLEPLVNAVHDLFNASEDVSGSALGHESRQRVGKKLLWGNVGASVASTFGVMAASMPEPSRVRDLAEEFMADAPSEVKASGQFVLFRGQAPEPIWAWERSSCCLWYQLEPADPSLEPFKCTDCSLWTAAERQARYEAATGASQ